MAELTVIPKKVGGSICVFLPADVVRDEGIQEGRPVHITVRSARTKGEAFGFLKGKLGPYRSRTEEGYYDPE